MTVRGRHRSEDGFTIVEILVATLLFMAASLGAAQIFISSTRVNFRAEQAQVALEAVQAEMERMRAISYDGIALTSAPTASADPADPASRIRASCANQGVSTNGCFEVSSEGLNPKPLVIEGGALENGDTIDGAQVDPGPEPFDLGDVRGEIHRYVVWDDDPSCATCDGLQDAKRLIVIATVESRDRTAPYREIQSEYIDPDVGKFTAAEPFSEDDAQTVNQQLYLSNTPCNRETRLHPADQPAHNTLGGCHEGLETGDDAGAPDLLTTSPPWGVDQEFDLSTDFEPLLVADQPNDRGRQFLPKVGMLTCDMSGLNHSRKHVWVTERIPSNAGGGSGYVLRDGVLSLSTRKAAGTYTAQPLNGAVCIRLFIRDENGEAYTDASLRNGDDGTNFFRYPHTWGNGWEELTIPLDLRSPSGSETIVVLPGQRLGIAIAIAQDAPDPLLEKPWVSVMYENPTIATRLEVETTFPYEGSPSLAG